MAYPTSVSIGTGNKVSINYQSQEVHLGVTYQLEREDTDLQAVIDEKAGEVETAHRRLWKQLRDSRNPAEEERLPASSNGAKTVTAKRAQESGDETQASTKVEPESAPPVSSPAANGSKVRGHRPAVSNGTQNGHQPLRARPNGTRPTEPMITDTQRKALGMIQERMQISDEDLTKRLDIRYGTKKVDDLTEMQATSMLMELQRLERSQRTGKQSVGQAARNGGMNNGNTTQRVAAGR